METAIISWIISGCVGTIAGSVNVQSATDDINQLTSPTFCFTVFIFFPFFNSFSPYFIEYMYKILWMQVAGWLRRDLVHISAPWWFSGEVAQLDVEEDLRVHRLGVFKVLILS